VFCLLTSEVGNANDSNADALEPQNASENSVMDKILGLPRLLFGKRERELPTE